MPLSPIKSIIKCHRTIESPLNPIKNPIEVIAAMAPSHQDGDAIPSNWNDAIFRVVQARLLWRLERLQGSTGG